MLFPSVAEFDRIGVEIDELGSVPKASNGSSCVVCKLDFEDFFDLRLRRRKRYTQPIMRSRTMTPPTAPPTIAPRSECGGMVFPKPVPVPVVVGSGGGDVGLSPVGIEMFDDLVFPSPFGVVDSEGLSPVGVETFDELVFPSLRLPTVGGVGLLSSVGVETTDRFDRRHLVPPVSSWFSHGIR